MSSNLRREAVATLLDRAADLCRGAEGPLRILARSYKDEPGSAPRRPRGPAAPPPPNGPVSELDKRRAMDALRRAGIKGACAK